MGFKVLLSRDVSRRGAWDGTNLSWKMISPPRPRLLPDCVVALGCCELRGKMIAEISVRENPPVISLVTSYSALTVWMEATDLCTNTAQLLSEEEERNYKKLTWKWKNCTFWNKLHKLQAKMAVY